MNEKLKTNVEKRVWAATYWAALTGCTETSRDNVSVALSAAEDTITAAKLLGTLDALADHIDAVLRPGNERNRLSKAQVKALHGPIVPREQPADGEETTD